MVWRPIDFRGIIGLDRSVIHQIDHYLQEKETRLANQILNILSKSSNPPTLPLGLGVHLKLSDAAEGLARQIRTSQLSSQDVDRLARELNTALWEFTEVLEGCAVELFQQLKQVNIDQWTSNLGEVVYAIKDSLLHRIEELMWVVRRLEGTLQEYRKKIGESSKGWKNWLSPNPGQLDPAILLHLKQSEEYLQTHYKTFQGQFNEYVRLSTQAEGFLEKMQHDPVLAIMGIEDQNLYVDLFRLLKIWELNPHPKGALAVDTIRAVKNMSSVNGAIEVFWIYYQELKDAFFSSSLELKAIAEQGHDQEERLLKLKEKVRNYSQELQQLIGTIGQYRDFILQTDKNPYVRSRWGFTESTVAPEPPKAKALLNLVYHAEELKGWYNRFTESLQTDLLSQERKENHAHEEIDRLLHEMGQPLISRHMMYNRAETLLSYIKDCDEIGSTHFETIQYIGNVFSKALRVDWKYHVLHEFPLFFELYHIHNGLQKPIEDPAHEFRLERFKQLFRRIEDWVNQDDIYSHVHEIELDMNDMKSYLQDFYATIQRVSNMQRSDPFLDDSINEFRQELLEYRFVFGQFFYHLMKKNEEGQQLRNQFLFVDQYFESVENLINDFRKEWEEQNR